MFDEKTQLKLKYYVYMLVDNKGARKTPFYVGKGKGNRVFDHIKCSIKNEDADKLKFKKIKSIKDAGREVEHIIVRHGLKEYEALEIESSLIDTLSYCGYALSNLRGGDAAMNRGLMTTDNVKRLYNAEPLSQMSSECVIININNSYKRGGDKESVYEATKGTWRMNQGKLIHKKTGNILRKYVLSEYKGWIVEVYEVHRWYKAPRPYGKNSKKYGQYYEAMAFEGSVAPNDVREKYHLKSIAHLKKKGSMNVVRYTL